MTQGAIADAKRAAAGLKGPPPQDPADVSDGRDYLECPVECLGFRDKILFFLSPEKNFEAIHIDDLTRDRILLLFDGETSWLYTMGAPERRAQSWRRDPVVEYLIKECKREGDFDYARKIRGPGAWRLEDGRLALHLGAGIRVYEASGEFEDYDVGSWIEDRIYVRGKPEPAPADKSASVENCDRLLSVLSTWNWARPADARIFLGFVGVSMICGALRFRPHVWLTGDTSTGKSTLEKFAFALLGSSALRSADATRAYIGAELAGAARPVLLDEVEPKQSPERVARLVDLARLGSTEDQAGVGRGSPSGKTIEHVIRACFMFSSINPAALERADRGRIAVLDLLPLDRPGDAAALQEIAEVKTLGPALRARMVEGYARFHANLETIRAAMAQHERGRLGDMLGSLLAASETLLSDVPIHPDDAANLVADYDTDEIIGSSETTDEMQCARHILSQSILVDASEGGRYGRTIAELVAAECVLEIATTRMVLARHGIILREFPSDGEGGTGNKIKWLVIANKHTELDRLYRGTQWAGGVWSTSFKRFRGAFRTKTPHRFAGFVSKAIAVPIDKLPIGKDDDKSDEPKGEAAGG